VPHVERRGTDLLAKACALDLQDIIVKWRHAPNGMSENHIQFSQQMQVTNGNIALPTTGRRLSKSRHLNQRRADKTLRGLEVFVRAGVASANSNLLVIVFARIALALFVVGFIMRILGPLIVFIDRRALRRGGIDAFRRGWLIVSTESAAAPGLKRRAGKLQTAQGEG
jgi:hypothetical protein